VLFVSDRVTLLLVCDYINYYKVLYGSVFNYIYFFFDDVSVGSAIKSE